VHGVFVTLDCTEPQPLAEFWAAFLDGEITFTTGQAVGERTDHVWLAAMRVDDHRPPARVAER
jgi:hypothetical protein